MNSTAVAKRIYMKFRIDIRIIEPLKTFVYTRVRDSFWRGANPQIFFFRDAQHADTQSHDILYRFMIETDSSFYIILQLIFSQSTFMDLKSSEECKLMFFCKSWKILSILCVFINRL